jgi:hypothetical protein
VRREKAVVHSGGIPARARGELPSVNKISHFPQRDLYRKRANTRCSCLRLARPESDDAGVLNEGKD